MFTIRMPDVIAPSFNATKIDIRPTNFVSSVSKLYVGLLPVASYLAHMVHRAGICSVYRCIVCKSIAIETIRPTVARSKPF